MPCDYKKYPKDWKQIRQRILEREGHKCKWCGVLNHDLGSRDANGKFYSVHDQIESVEETGELPDGIDMDSKIITIILTISHLDHDISNNADDNLAALCQRCHLGHDREQHTANAAATRDRKRGQQDLLNPPPAP